MSTISMDYFSKVDLRTAKVLECREHPNAEKLLILQVEVGDVKKQIVAGLKLFYPPETLVGRTILIVNNLDPVVLRGEESSGMVLTTNDGTRPHVVFLDQGELVPASGCGLK